MMTIESLQQHTIYHDVHIIWCSSLLPCAHFASILTSHPHSRFFTIKLVYCVLWHGHACMNYDVSKCDDNQLYIYIYMIFLVHFHGFTQLSWVKSFNAKLHLRIRHASMLNWKGSLVSKYAITWLGKCKCLMARWVHDSCVADE